MLWEQFNKLKYTHPLNAVLSFRYSDVENWIAWENAHDILRGTSYKIAQRVWSQCCTKKICNDMYQYINSGYLKGKDWRCSPSANF